MTDLDLHAARDFHAKESMKHFLRAERLDKQLEMALDWIKYRHCTCTDRDRQDGRLCPTCGFILRVRNYPQLGAK